MLQLPTTESGRFVLRNALIGAAVAGVLIELASSVEPGRAQLSACMAQPVMKQAQLSQHPGQSPRNCHDH